MYSQEQKQKAIETYIKFGHSVAETRRELGYPNKATLYKWWHEYQRCGEIIFKEYHRKSKYTEEQKQVAVEHYLTHGKNLRRTVRALGYSCRDLLARWVEELAPGVYIHHRVNHKKEAFPIEVKIQAVVDLEARSSSAAKVAESYGISRVTPYAWRREILGHNSNNSLQKGNPVNKPYDELPNDIKTLEKNGVRFKSAIEEIAT